MNLRTFSKMRLTIGKKISIAMAIMIVLVAISALTANLSLISIQGSVGEMVSKTSPLIMATQAMIAYKTQASFELHNYLTERNPGKLAAIEKRYKKYVAAHDLYEQKIFECVDGLPAGNAALKKVLADGIDSVVPQFREASQKVIQVHNELLDTCIKRVECMNKHEQSGLKLLKLLVDTQDKYVDDQKINRTLMNLKTAHSMTVLAEQGYIGNVTMLTPEERVTLKKKFAREDGGFLDEFRLLKEAMTGDNDVDATEAIYQMHNDYINSAVGESRLFDLYEREIALKKKQNLLITAVDELDVADFAMATKLLELASINLSDSGAIAYRKAGNIPNGLLVFCVVALVISISVMMNLSKRIVRPVLALAEASSKIAIGDLNQKINVSGNDEVDELCRSFNTMSENLQAEVSVRKKSEREREQLLEILEEKNRELQNVVYVASHDLRSPLVTINGFSEELGILCGEIENILESENIDEDVKSKIIPLLKEGIPEDLRFITAGAEKMQMLINGLLQISRAGTAAVDMTTLDMNSLLKSINDAMQYGFTSKDISVTIRDLPRSFGDANMINQVFSNLIDNAVKYRQGCREDKIVVSGWVESGNSVYCVEDNGIGISAGSQLKIFEIFHRLDPHGSIDGEGLGLTIISRILDRHHGKIWVESEPGQGSKFFISLPSGA